MSHHQTPSRMKDVLLEHVSRDVKELQSLQSDTSTVVDMIPNSNRHAQALCEHLDHILMHGLREYTVGYWPFVSYFTRSEAIHTITNLSNVTTEVGRGRAWLYMALNEQAMESYIRMFLENQLISQEFYLRESFLRDMERLLVLLTLVSGLDFISFDLSVDCDYMDYGPTLPSAQLGITRSTELTPDVEPRFISSVDPTTQRQSGFSLSGIFGNMFKEEPTDHDAQLPSNSSTEEQEQEGTGQPEMPDVTMTTADGESNVPIKKAAKQKSSRDESSDGLVEQSVNTNETNKGAEKVDDESIASVTEARSSLPQGKIIQRHAPIEIPGARRSHGVDGSSDALESGSLPSSQIPLLQRMSGSGFRDQLSRSVEGEGEETAKAGRGGGGEEEVEDGDIAVHVGSGKRKPKRKKKKRRSDEVSLKSSGSGSSRREHKKLQQEATREPAAEPAGAPEETDRIDELALRGDVLNYDGDIQVPELRGSPEPDIHLSLQPTGGEEGGEGEGGERGGDEGGGMGGGGGRGGQSVYGESRLSADSGNVVEFEVEETAPQHTGEGGEGGEVEERQERRASEIELQISTASLRVKDSLQGSTGYELDTNMAPILSSSLPEVRDSVEVSLLSDQHMESTGGDESRGGTSHKHQQVNLGPSEEFVSTSAEEQLSRGTDEQGLPHRMRGESLEPSKTRPMLVSPLTEPSVYKITPERPQQMTDIDRYAADVKIDENMRLVFSLDVFFTAEEQIKRLIQVSTPAGVGQQRTGYVLISSNAVYLLRNDGIEGLFSRELGIKYTEFEHIVIGLGWQSVIFVYSTNSLEEEKCVILSSSEAVSRSIADSIRSAAAQCPGFLRSIPLNRDDESRIEAIEKELIKQGSQTSMDIVRYSLVNWEQLSGLPPPIVAGRLNPGVFKSGVLQFKSVNMIGISQWKPAYFELRDGLLHQYNSESDKIVRNTYQVRNCGGCTRSTAESKPYALSVMGSDGPSVVLATSTEEELAHWMAALCQAAIEEAPTSPTLKSCFCCAMLLTQNKIHVLQEDWTNESVQLVTSCWVTDVNGIGVDRTLPLYCTISYDQGVWLVCFSSEYELGKFESALAATWKEQFQIDLQFSEVNAPEVRERAHRAVELMQGSRYRSDSITRGRTEFTYSATF